MKKRFLSPLFLTMALAASIFAHGKSAPQIVLDQLTGDYYADGVRTQPSASAIVVVPDDGAEGSDGYAADLLWAYENRLWIQEQEKMRQTGEGRFIRLT